MDAAARAMGARVDQVDAGGQNIASWSIGDGGQEVRGPLAETIIGRVQAGSPEGDAAAHTGDDRALGVLGVTTSGPSQPQPSVLQLTVHGRPVREL